VSAATQSQALAALLFLYKRVLNVDLPWIDNVVRATRPKRLPTVLGQQEAQSVLANLQGVYWLIGVLLYGSGLRLTEALRLRIKDLELENLRILVRDGKGGKDRVTILPESLVTHLRAHLAKIRELHRQAIEHRWARALKSAAVTTYTKTACNGMCETLPAPLASRSPYHLIRSAIALRHTCWRTATTFVLCRN